MAKTCSLFWSILEVDFDIMLLVNLSSTGLLACQNFSLDKINEENAVATLKEQIREAARVAEEISAPDEFNAMSWLDLLLEDNPESFDSLFDRTWNELSGEERAERVARIREVL